MTEYNWNERYILTFAEKDVVLSTKDLHVYYGGKEAINGIDMQFEKNKITALIGPSGCGKSTFLRSLNRMNDTIDIAKVTGQILYKGIDVNRPEINVYEMRKHIGMVFQRPNPFAKSIYRNITFAHDHALTEYYIKSLGFTYTFIRDNFYLDFFIDMCLEYGYIQGPAGNGKVSAVLRDDVAAASLEILQNPKKWGNQILNMTGPSSLTMTELTKKVGQVLKKEIFYIEETIEEAYQSRKKWKAAPWEYDSWVSTYTAIANGELEEVSSDIERILGRPATSLDSYLQHLITKK